MLGLRRHASGRSSAIQYAQNAKAWVRDYCTAIKWGRWHPFTPLERKAREATRNEAWGPTGTLLNELAEATTEIESCQIIFAVLELRMGYPPEKWRNVYKALQVLEFLAKRGSDHCIAFAKDDIQICLKNLKEFDYIGPDGRDYGVNVRIRADAIEKLLEDEDLLMRDRAQLKSKMKKNFQGFSRTEMEAYDGVGRANSWGGSMRNPSVRELNAPDVIETVEGTALEQKSRGAGEMKGISLEENKKNIAALKQIMSRDKNRVCADCIGGSQPTWASINCGVFICMKCAGIHRGLGVHISKVRSCTLDTWLPEQVGFMDHTGNKIANAFWEAKLPEGSKPVCGDPNLESFIRRKYSKMYAQGSWPPEAQMTPVAAEPEVHPSAETKNPGVFWNMRDKSINENVQGFEDNIFDIQGPANENLHVAQLHRQQDSAFKKHEPTQSVLLPASRASNDSVLFHAHTYPDFLTYDGEAFPSSRVGDPQQSVPQTSNNSSVPQQPIGTTQKNQKQLKDTTKSNARGLVRSRGGSSVIITNELDLDDLDDVESMYGFGLISPNDDKTRQTSTVSGFEEHADWPSDTSQQYNTQVMTSSSSHLRTCQNANVSAIGNPGVHNVKQGSNMDHGEQLSTRQKDLSLRVRLASPRTNAVTNQSQIPSQDFENVEKMKNPIDSLDSDFAFDFLSGGMVSVQDQPCLPEGNSLKDPFSDLEPLELLTVEPIPSETLHEANLPAPGPTMPATEANSFQEKQSGHLPGIHMGSALSNDKQEYSSRQRGSFIGEGGAYCRKYHPSDRAIFNQYNGSKNFAAVGQVVSPAHSMSPGNSPVAYAQVSKMNAQPGWHKSSSGLVDIDKILLQQIERLEINGSRTRGAQNGGLSGVVRKSSGKRTHATFWS